MPDVIRHPATRATARAPAGELLYRLARPR